VTQNGHVRGVLKGQESRCARWTTFPFEDRSPPGDVLFTSGDDHIFRAAFRGRVKSVRNGQPFKEIWRASGLRRGVPEDVLFIVEGAIRTSPRRRNQTVYINPSPTALRAAEETLRRPPPARKADRARRPGQGHSESQGHRLEAETARSRFQREEPVGRRLRPRRAPDAPPAASNSTRRPIRPRALRHGGKQDCMSLFPAAGFC